MTNILTVTMHHEKVSREEAVIRVSNLHKQLLDRLKYLLGHLPELLPSYNVAIDEAVQTYIWKNLVPWVRANVEWSFDCRRYFGDKGSEARSTRMVPLHRGEAAKHCVPLKVPLEF
jgi:hypothetical protein